MQIKRWQLWLLVLLVLLFGVGGFGLITQSWLGAATFGRVLLWIAAVGSYLWLWVGIIPNIRERWGKQAAWALGLSTAILGASILLHRTGFVATAIGAIGLWSMTAMFILGLMGANLLLLPSHPITGIARTFLNEAVRMKVAIIFIIALIVLVAVMPLMLSTESRLQYRIQSFLSWSIGGTALLLSLMTIFLAVATITNEMKHRQIFMTMTKPVAYWHYLAGKFIGLMLLNFVLLSTAGLGIYSFARILEVQPAMDATDFYAVREQVLTARAVIKPVPPPTTNFEEMFEQRLRQLRTEDEARYGAMPDADMRRNIETFVIVNWHTIPPLGSRSFYFPDVGQARQYSDTVQLRVRPRGQPSAPDRKVRMAMMVNGRAMNYNPQQGQVHSYEILERHAQTIDIPVNVADEDGGMLIRIDNINLPSGISFNNSIHFVPNEGIEMLYTVGSFEANFIRALLIEWFKLCFFAMFGLAAGTFLGFPVAALLACMVYFGSLMGAFLTESLRGFAPLEDADDLGAWETFSIVFSNLGVALSRGQIGDAGTIFIRVLGEIFLLFVPRFHEYDSAGRIAEGLVIMPGEVAQAAVWTLVIWMGVVAIGAWLIFGRRELARIIV